MSVCSQLFTLKADSNGADILRVPPFEGWFLHCIRFLTPASPRVRLPNGSNVRWFDPYKDGDIITLGLLVAGIGFSNTLVITNLQDTYPIWATVSSLVSKTNTSSYSIFPFNNLTLNDWETQLIAVAPSNSNNIVVGAEWDIEFILTDNVAGRVPSQPFPRGFKAIS